MPAPDEVYRGVELDPSRTLPQAADLSPSALSLGVMSKAYGLPGLRVGWVAYGFKLDRAAGAKNVSTLCWARSQPYCHEQARVFVPSQVP